MQKVESIRLPVVSHDSSIIGHDFLVSQSRNELLQRAYILGY